MEGPLAKTAEVDVDMGSASLDREVHWKAEVPFLVGQAPVEVHHAEPDCLFGDVRHLKPGDVIRQHVCLGGLPDIFAAFANEWSKRWVKTGML